MTSAVAAARFPIVRRLGEGTMGVVYEAVDRDRGARIAVKTLRNVTTESMARLEREFLALQGVRHTNLVALGEFVRDGEQSLFTMELVEGTDFLEYVRSEGRGEGEPRFDEVRLRDELSQLADGLSALHEAGLVHRDVKPSNVRVTREGRVVLLDFGLVIASSADDASIQHAAGTPWYMAPEQAVSSQVGPEADWYAVGVLLFEALTGNVPFEGAALRVMTRKQKEEPSAPSAVVGGVPADLDALCTALLRFDPAARPGGHHVQRALGKRNGVSRGHASQTQATRFVGRATELEALESAFRDVRDGHPVTVALEGGSGMGKSALVRRFRQRLALERPETLVIVGRCCEGDARPFAGVAGIVESLASFLSELDAAEAPSLAPAKAWPLVTMFPALRRVEAIAEVARRPQRLAHALVGVRTRAFEGFRELVKAVGAGRTLVFAVDDAQRIDADSLALLADLVRPPDAPGLLLVLIAQDPVPWLSSNVRRIPLGPLPSEDARTLAAAILERAGITRTDVAERCALAAAGNPLAIDLTALHLEQLTEAETPILEDVVARVVRRIEEAPRAVLETLAVAGAPLASQAIARATGLAGHELSRAVSILRVAHLAQAGSARGADPVEAYHDRIGAAVLARLDEPRRAEIHRRIAVALETSDHGGPLALAMHWRDAGDRAQMAHYAALAGDQAVEGLAFERGASLYELALSGADSSEDGRQGLLVKLAEARANARQGRAASEAFSAAAARATGWQELELRRRAAEELLMIGDIDAGTEKLRDVTRQVGMWMPRSPAATIVALLVFRGVLWFRGMRFELRDEAAIAPRDVTRIWVCAGVSRVLGLIDLTLAAYFQTRMLLFALASGSAYGLSYATSLEACFVSARGVRTRARTDELLALADEMAQKSAVPRARVMAIFARGFVTFVLGRPVDALERLERAVAAALDSATWDHGATQTVRLATMSALAEVGSLEELTPQLESALREAEGRGDLTMATAIWIYPSFWRSWLARIAPDAVRAAIEEAMARWTRRAYHNYHHWACAALTEVALYEGRGRQAFDLVAADFTRARRALKFTMEKVHVSARQLRSRAATLAAAQERRPKQRARLLAWAERDARWLRRAPPDDAKGWAALVEAGISGVRGDRARAVASLEDAIARFDAKPDRFASACARMRLGALLGDGDDRGRALLEEGQAFMRQQGVADPHRMAAALVPGVVPRAA